MLLTGQKSSSRNVIFLSELGYAYILLERRKIIMRSVAILVEAPLCQFKSVGSVLPARCCMDARLVSYSIE